MKDRVTNPLGGSLWHRGLWVTLLMGNHLCDDGDKEVNAWGCGPSVVGPLGMRRARVSTTAYYPSPSGPAPSPHQMPARSKGQRFIFWNDHSSNTLVLQALLTVARWRLVCLIPALLGGLKCRHFTEGPNRERQKPKVPIMLQNYSSASNHVRGCLCAPPISIRPSKEPDGFLLKGYLLAQLTSHRNVRGLWPVAAD